MDNITDLMAISAKSAPKVEGISNLEIAILDDAEKEILAEEMFQLADEFNDESYSSLGINIESAERIMLIGLEDPSSIGLDCKACGFKDCAEFDEKSQKGIFEGPNCIFKVLDLGIALGSALKTAMMHNVRADVIIKGGLAAKDIGLSSSTVCLAIPVTLDETKGYH